MRTQTGTRQRASWRPGTRARGARALRGGPRARPAWPRSARRSPAGRRHGFPEAEALFGLFAYDAVRYLERLPDTTRDDLGLPDIDVFLPGRLLRYDLAAGEVLLLDRLSSDDDPRRRRPARA